MTSTPTGMTRWKRLAMTAGLAAITLTRAGDVQPQPVVELAHTPFDGRASIAPLLLLALDVDDGLADSAWPGPYLDTRAHEGYFNHRKCYRFANGRFNIESDADRHHACNGKGYSGNFLNWAGMTVGDTLRYGLTGGQRVVDTAGDTVLERIDVGNPASAAASLRKSVTTDAKAIMDIKRLTPFDTPAIYTMSCGTRLLLASRPFSGNCRRLDSSDRLLADLPLRVRVCDLELEQRRFCVRYARTGKPEGELQRAAPGLRIALLTDKPGAAPQVPARNLVAEWSPDTGIATPVSSLRSREGGGVLASVNRIAASPGHSRQRGRVYRDALAYLGKKGAGNPVLAACQQNTVLYVAAPIVADSQDGSNGSYAYGQSQAGTALRQIMEMERDADGRYGNPSPAPSLALMKARSAAMQTAALAYQANTGGGAHAATPRSATIVVETGAPRAQASATLQLAAKYGGFDDSNQDGNPFRTALPPEVTWESAGQVEWDRNHDGIADRYHPAADGEQLLQGLRSAFLQIARSRLEHMVPDTAAVALAQGGDLFLASYEPRTWSGSIRRYRLGRTSDGKFVRSATPVWESSIPAPDKRRLVTLGRNADGNIVTMALDWMQLSPDQQSLLDTSQAGDRDGLGPQRLEWLRGDRRTEQGNGGMLRRRQAMLGDLIHSNLVLLPATAAGPTTPAATPADSSAAISSADPASMPKKLPAPAAPQPDLLFAGANDGLLHAFDAATGKELFAYLPSMLLRDVPALTSPIYLHRAFIDGGLETGKLALNGKETTLLAGSLGRGGRGIFVLDVSDPNSFARNGAALLEFSVDDDPGIGHVLGPPRLVRVAASFPSGPAQRPFVLAQAGVNARSGLFLIGLDRAAGESWQQGVNYFRIEVESGAIPSAHPGSSHLGPPGLVLAKDGTLAHAWAGDVAGNLWRFSFAPDRKVSAGFKVDVKLVFQAQDAQGNPQPITAGPRIAHANGGGYIVLFGTGKLLEHADVAAGALGSDSVYAIHDRGMASVVPASRAALAERQAQPAPDGGWRVTGDAFDYGDTIRGWRLDLPTTGEKVVSSPVLADGRLHVITTLVSSDPCQAAGSRAWSVDVLTGLSESAAINVRSGLALLRTPLLLHSAGAARVPGASGRRPSSGTYSMLFQDPGTTGSASATSHPSTGPTGRLSWREISNWNQLREDALGQ